MTIKHVQDKGYEVKETTRTIPCTEITNKEAFCLLWRSRKITASDDMGGYHRVLLDAPYHDGVDIPFEVLSDAQLRGRGLEVPPRRVWDGNGFHFGPSGPLTLFEDMNYTVKDHGPKIGVQVEFVGYDFDDTEISGSKYFIDEAGKQVRQIVGNGASTTIPAKLERLVDYKRVWQTLDRGHTRWCREAPGGIVYVVKEEGEDGAVQYWLQTQDEAGHPVGPRETAEVFDVVGAREEGRKLAESAFEAPKP